MPPQASRPARPVERLEPGAAPGPRSPGQEGRRAYLHCDVDKMFYSVEAIERPELADDPRPVIVGWDPSTAPRGIATTANAAARALGISSGLSTSIARRLAHAAGTEAVFIPPRHELYRRYSRRLIELLRTETPLLEQRSIDEAALDWSHHGFDASPVARLRARILGEIGLSVSCGLATNLLVAKIASEVAKERESHLCVVPPGDEAAFLAPLPIRALVGIGPKTEARLRRRGVERIGALASLPLDELVTRFGAASGRYLHRASRGEDDSGLAVAHASKSISAEHTFSADTRDPRELWRRLRAQTEEVAQRLRTEGLVAGEVAVKLRYANWETITRQMRLGAPTDDARVLASGAAALMRRHWDQRRPVRLVGLRAARLSEPATAVQPPLLPATA